MAALKGEKIVARILNRRGSRLNLPQPLEPGELGWCLDTKQLFVGLDSENAIAAIQAFNNVDMDDVNYILNNYVIQIKTPWIRLKTPASPTATNPNEYDALTSLAAIPQSSFVLEHNLANIRAAETKIKIINDMRLKIASLFSTFPATILYDWEEESPAAATATATLLAGQVTGITINSHGRGYLGGQTPTVVITGDGTNATATASVNADTGLVSVVVTNPGSGYTTATVAIQNPSATTAVANLVAGGIRTTNVFQFTFHVGIGSGTHFPTTPTMSAAITSLNLNTFRFYQDDGTNDVNGFQFCINDSAGVMGINGGVPVDHNYEMTNGLLYLSTMKQTANLAGLINKLAPVDSYGYVTTKQNVEIVTEQSMTLISQMFNDFLIENPLCYSLPPTASYPTNYDPVLNDGSNPLYSSMPLIYDYGINDVQVIEYSLIDDTQKMLRTGKLIINTLDTGVAVVEDEYTENRDGSITPVSSGGPDFDFNATVAGSTVTVEYRHNFVGYVDLKITTRRWKSFNV